MISSGDSGLGKKLNVISRRMFILSSAKVIIFGGIFARLFSLQINENKKYLTLSDKNRLREWRLPPVRGDFLDYFGNVIAGNSEVYQLHIIPEEVSNFKSLMVRLKEILSLSENEYNKILKRKEQRKPWQTLIISENLSWEQFSKINLYLHELEGAKPVLSTSRFYPYANDLVHIVGYVGDASLKDIEKPEINIFPDTLVWTSDYTYSYNDPISRNYFHHPSFDDYPVVGVSWKQAVAFSKWRTHILDNYLTDREEPLHD